MNTNYACAAQRPNVDVNCGQANTLAGCVKITSGTYNYLGGGSSDPMQNADCAEKVGQTCVYGHIGYSCKVKDEERRETRNCASQKYCIGDNCLDTPQPSSMNDMMLAVGTMEAVRQAGTYQGNGNFQIFKGVVGRCRKTLLKNCCLKTSGKAQSNRSVLTDVAMASLPYLGNEAVTNISSYVYDFMYNNNIYADWALKGLERVGGEILSSQISTTYGSLYGVTAWSGSAAAPTGIWGNAMTDLGSIGDFNFSFDPYSLMFSLAVQEIMKLLSCDQEDLMTNQRNVSRLCNPIGEYCSRRIPIIGICIEHAISHCCYNSRLARIFQTPRDIAQVGRASNPVCDGMTPEQFSNLNFDDNTLREFYDEIKPADFSASRSVNGHDLNTFTPSRVDTLVNERTFK